MLKTFKSEIVSSNEAFIELQLQNKQYNDLKENCRMSPNKWRKKAENSRLSKKIEALKRKVSSLYSFCPL